MTENPYAVSADELEAGARVPLSEQVEEQATSNPVRADRADAVQAYGDGMSGDMDGE